MKKLLTTLSTIWENTYGCVEQYICSSELYRMSDMLQCYSIIIDRGISAPGHVKEVVVGLNSIDKLYIYQLMSNVQLLGSKTFDLHIAMHACTQKKDFSLAKQFQKHLSMDHRKHGVIDQVKYRKQASKRK